MKRFAMFALFVCLVVLAVALVYGLTYPEVTDGIFGALRSVWDRIAIFFEYMLEGLRATLEA